MTEPIDVANLRRLLAEIEHTRWAHWQTWMHGQGIRQTDGGLRLPGDLVERWERQIATPYAHLTQREQASDMEQVDRYWPHIQALLDRLAAAEARVAVVERHRDEIDRRAVAAEQTWAEQLQFVYDQLRVKEERVAALTAAGTEMRAAIDGMSERYAEMFRALGLGDPLDSVALQDCAVAVAAWTALLETPNSNRVNRLDLEQKARIAALEAAGDAMAAVIANANPGTNGHALGCSLNLVLSAAEAEDRLVLSAAEADGDCDCGTWDAVSRWDELREGRER